MIYFLLTNGGYCVDLIDLRLKNSFDWWVRWYEYESDITTSLNLML